MISVLVPDDHHGQLAKISVLIDEGKVAAPEITAYPMDRAGEARDLLNNGRIRGKLVIDISKVN